MCSQRISSLHRYFQLQQSTGETNHGSLPHQASQQSGIRHVLIYLTLLLDFNRSEFGSKIEVHPYLSQKPLINLCRQYEIVVSAYGPIGRPGLSQDPVNDPVLIDDPIIKEIANKYSRTVAQVILRYLVRLSTHIEPLHPSRCAASISPSRPPINAPITNPFSKYHEFFQALFFFCVLFCFKRRCKDYRSCRNHLTGLAFWRIWPRSNSISRPRISLF